MQATVCAGAGVRGVGASKQTVDGTRHIHVVPVQKGQGTLRVVASRTHRGAALDAWLVEAGRQFAAVETVSMGSSLKICLVAEGAADLYPRLAPTCEWDTAAAQAVLEAAGGSLVDPLGDPYRYNRKSDLLNPCFLAIGDQNHTFPAPVVG